jgi:hypothetical protein
VSSNINYLSINENFPVAGVDNDTQTLRDNFDTIKTSLRRAQEEVTDLQNKVVLKEALLDEELDNDFNLNTIRNAVLDTVRYRKFDAGNPVTVSPTTIDFQNGHYQIYRIGGNISLDFLNFPGDPELTAEPVPVGVGKVTLELYGGTIASVVTVGFSTSNGTVIKKDPSFPSVLTLNSGDDPVIIEVWRHSQEVIFVRYLGKFA